MTASLGLPSEGEGERGYQITLYVDRQEGHSLDDLMNVKSLFGIKDTVTFDNSIKLTTFLLNLTQRPVVSGTVIEMHSLCLQTPGGSYAH